MAFNALKRIEFGTPLPNNGHGFIRYEAVPRLLRGGFLYRRAKVGPPASGGASVLGIKLSNGRIWR